MNKQRKYGLPSAPVFKDKEMLTPVSPTDTVGYAMFGGAVTLVILMKRIWIPAAIASMPSLDRLLGAA